MAKPGNAGLKVFIACVPSCICTFPKAGQTWYILFTKIATTTGFYLHPYFCFHKHADFNYGFTCGFYVAAVAAVTAVAKVLHRPHIPEVVTVVHVPTDPVAGTAKVHAVTSVPEVLQIVHVPAVLMSKPSIRSSMTYLLFSNNEFQIGLASHIWVIMTKANVLKKHSPQYNILHQYPGDGYSALFQFISLDHPTLGKFPHLVI